MLKAAKCKQCYVETETKGTRVSLIGLLDGAACAEEVLVTVGCGSLAYRSIM